MKPEPPVTRIFTAGNLLRPSGQPPPSFRSAAAVLQVSRRHPQLNRRPSRQPPPFFTLPANHVPDLSSGEVPRQATFVALIGLRREVGVDEIDDASAHRRQV